MVFKSLFVLLLWTKVALALKGLILIWCISINGEIIGSRSCCYNPNLNLNLNPNLPLNAYLTSNPVLPSPAVPSIRRRARKRAWQEDAGKSSTKMAAESLWCSVSSIFHSVSSSLTLPYTSGALGSLISPYSSSFTSSQKSLRAPAKPATRDIQRKPGTPTLQWKWRGNNCDLNCDLDRQFM